MLPYPARPRNNNSHNNLLATLRSVVPEARSQRRGSRPMLKTRGKRLYTPDLTNMNIHWKMRLEIPWQIPVQIHWTSDHMLGEMPLELKGAFSLLESQTGQRVGFSKG